MTLRGLGKASGWPSENWERMVSDPQRTREGHWMTIRGPRKESGRTLEDLAKVICGHWRIWKGQSGPPEDLRRAVGVIGGLGKVRGGLGRGTKQLLEDLGSLEDTILFCFFPLAHRMSAVLYCQFLGSFLSCP